MAEGPSRPPRVIIAKPGLDGHDRGAKILTLALRDAGMEVIYTGLHQTPELIVAAAEQEDVDAIGLSILSGVHLELTRAVMDLLRTRGSGEIPVVVGGTIPDRDVDKLKEMGTFGVFGVHSRLDDIIDCFRRAARRPELQGGER